MQLSRSKWFLPVFAVVLGLVMFCAQWIGGHPRAGIGSLGIMAAFGAIILLGGRSETIRGLRGDGRDERFKQLDIHATALAGMVVIGAVIVAFVVQLARNENPAPFDWLGAIGGLSYLAAVVVLRLRG